MQVKRRSNVEGLPKLVQAVIEIQREHTCDPIGGFRPEIARYDPGTISEVPVRDDDALGPAGGS